MTTTRSYWQSETIPTHTTPPSDNMRRSGAIVMALFGSANRDEQVTRSESFF